jgi:hypothetical protein
MPQLLYTPDEDVKVHEENAIKLIRSEFQSHETGLPEWLKNSANAYTREDAPEAKRVIVVILGAMVDTRNLGSQLVLTQALRSRSR